jgi:hypothetical protein
MNSVVIFLVPAGLPREDFETALREHSAALEIGEAQLHNRLDHSEPDKADELPMWTWFIPNPLFPLPQGVF